MKQSKRTLLTLWLTLSLTISGLMFIYPEKDCVPTGFINRATHEKIEECESKKYEYVSLLVTCIGSVLIVGIYKPNNE
jgi:hypothetical protein